MFFPYLVKEILFSKSKPFPNTTFSIKIKSPEQNIEEPVTDGRNKEISEYEGVNVAVNLMLDYKQKTNDPFFRRRRHKDLKV